MGGQSSNTPGLGASLVVLASPPSLVAIALLLINDHLFKQMWPSLVTGKLSDFAGLYFAPYVLLAAMFVIPFKALQRKPFSLARIVYLAIATGFVALKVSEATAAPLLAAASGLGFPVVITADPSDLAALCMLPLSYVAWSARMRQLAGQPRRLLHSVTFAVAALSIVASSTAQPEISSIAIDAAGDVYAAVEYTSADGVYVADFETHSWRKLATTGRQLVADPHRPGTVYLLEAGRAAPTVGRLTSDGVKQIGPPPPDARRSAVYGPSLLVAAPWVHRTLFVSRNGELLTTNDNGGTWVNVGTPGEMRALAVSSEEGLIYIVTGSALTPGVAWLYRSRDAGSHWTYMESLEVGSYGSATVAVHPTDGQLVFLGTATELRRSADGGLSFSTVITQAGTNWTWEVRFDPTDDYHLLLIQGFGCCPLLESRDRGVTWLDAGINAKEVAVAPNGDVYAVSGAWDKVLRRVGKDWADVTYTLPVHRSR
jgi:hypothetical protein